MLKDYSVVHAKLQKLVHALQKQRINHTIHHQEKYYRSSVDGLKARKQNDWNKDILNQVIKFQQIIISTLYMVDFHTGMDNNTKDIKLVSCWLITQVATYLTSASSQQLQ